METKNVAVPKAETKRPKNTADVLVDCLEAEQVEYVFGIPGEEVLDLIEALSRSEKIRFITTRHEQGAAFMADVYGRLTGKAGVCLSTLGPGATNLVTGVADANLDGAPLIAITGQAGTDRMHLTSHQFVDLIKMFEPVTKRSKQIVRPDTVAEIIRIAFKYAESEKPGASHINLPQNIAKMSADGVLPLKKAAVLKELADNSTIEIAAEAITKAKRPVVLAGSSAISTGAAVAVTKLAETLHLPVINTMMGKGIIPFDNRYAMWTIGIPQKDYVDQIFKEADLVVAIGYDIVEFAPGKWNPNSDKAIVHIAPSAAHINRCYQPLTEVVGDISDALTRIMALTKREEEPAWAFAIREKIVRDHETYANDLSFPMKPQRILSDVRKVMGPDDILLSDVGAHKMWIARHYNCYKPNTCIISNGFASMGISIPGAVAAKLLYPKRRILAVCGDGGFMMNMQELETAKRIGTPFVTLVLNDGGYGLIKWKQQEQFGHANFVDFTNPDFKLLAQAMGCKGYRVEKAEDLIPMLDDAFMQDVPAIIDCPIDYSENLRLTKRLKELV